MQALLESRYCKQSTWFNTEHAPLCLSQQNAHAHKLAECAPPCLRVCGVAREVCISCMSEWVALLRAPSRIRVLRLGTQARTRLHRGVRRYQCAWVHAGMC